MASVRVPTWEEFMTPTLRVLSDGHTRNRRDMYPLAAREVRLSESQLNEVLPSGQLVYHNRLGWALSFLNNVGALERPSRGNYRITEAGRHLLE